MSNERLASGVAATLRERVQERFAKKTTFLDTEIIEKLDAWAEEFPINHTDLDLH